MDSMSEAVTGPSSQALRQLLEGSNEFTPPRQLLLDLSAEEATKIPPNVPHSIAQIVAHMHFWQDFMLDLMQEKSPRYPASEEAGWPEVSADQWLQVRTDFLAGLDELQQLTYDEKALAREYKPGTTVGYLICDAALHNAYHVGQIVLLRCQMGLWPSVEGKGYGYW